MTLLQDSPIAATIALRQTVLQQPSDALAAKDFYFSSPGESPGRQRVFLITSDGSPLVTPTARYVESEINALLRLSEAWDGMRAHPVTQEAASAAIRMVFAIANDQSLPPQFFPLPDGGVQLEWHVARHDLEIEIDAAGNDHHILATDSCGKTTLEGEFSPHDTIFISRIRDAIHQLSRLAAGAR